MFDSNELERSPEAEIDVAGQTSSTAIRYSAIKEHLYSDLNGEAVVLNLRNGKYYGLNAVGNSIWGLIQTPKSLREIQTSLISEYEMEPEICRLAAEEFLNKMT